MDLHALYSGSVSSKPNKNRQTIAILQTIGIGIYVWLHGVSPKWRFLKGVIAMAMAAMLRIVLPKPSPN